MVRKSISNKYFLSICFKELQQVRILKVQNVSHCDKKKTKHGVVSGFFLGSEQLSMRLCKNNYMLIHTK